MDGKISLRSHLKFRYKYSIRDDFKFFTGSTNKNCFMINVVMKNLITERHTKCHRTTLSHQNASNTKRSKQPPLVATEGNRRIYVRIVSFTSWKYHMKNSRHTYTSRAMNRLLKNRGEVKYKHMQGSLGLVRLFTVYTLRFNRSASDNLWERKFFCFYFSFFSFWCCIFLTAFSV